MTRLFQDDKVQMILNTYFPNRKWGRWYWKPGGPWMRYRLGEHPWDDAT